MWKNNAAGHLSNDSNSKTQPVSEQLRSTSPMHGKNEKVRRKSSRPEVISEKEELAGDDEENSFSNNLNSVDKNQSPKSKAAKQKNAKTNKVDYENNESILVEGDSTQLTKETPKTKVCCKQCIIF